MEHSSTTTNTVRSYALVIGVSLFTIVADQISKRIVLSAFQPGEIRPVIPDLFNLTLTYNRGAAFGLWGDLPPGWREAALGVSIALALAVVVFFLRQPPYQNTVGRISLAGILGGALGNVIDRFTYGAVVDFLDVYVGTYHWPAFNVADSAITLGVIALILMPQRKVSAQTTSNG
jgi:signal peptidase II